MIKRTHPKDIASVKLSPTEKNSETLLIILGEDAEGISVWDVERIAETI